MTLIEAMKSGLLIIKKWSILNFDKAPPKLIILNHPQSKTTSDGPYPPPQEQHPDVIHIHTYTYTLMHSNDNVKPDTPSSIYSLSPQLYKENSESLLP